MGDLGVVVEEEGAVRAGAADVAYMDEYSIVIIWDYCKGLRK